MINHRAAILAVGSKAALRQPRAELLHLSTSASSCADGCVDVCPVPRQHSRQMWMELLTSCQTLEAA